MSEANLVDFTKQGDMIVKALKLRSEDFSDDERIRYIYNEATDDAINFVAEMGKRNPEHRLTCMALEREMREWLPLRSEPVLE